LGDLDQADLKRLFKHPIMSLIIDMAGQIYTELIIFGTLAQPVVCNSTGRSSFVSG
jgi:hypothetical protein